MITGQITSVTFFKLSHIFSGLWAFGQMQFAHSSLRAVDGQHFYKLMGSGKGTGFNPWPDWSLYVLLQVWTNEGYADNFFRNSPFFRSYRDKSSAYATVYAQNTGSHGSWGGRNPFSKSEAVNAGGPQWVLTRATIKSSMLRKFWGYVPTSGRPLATAPGLIYTKGVGEWPLTQMATLSFWESADAMKNFAYGSPEHKKAIALTKALNWYKEELFARFVPYRMTGNLHSLDRLRALLI